MDQVTVHFKKAMPTTEPPFWAPLHRVGQGEPQQAAWRAPESQGSRGGGGGVLIRRHEGPGAVARTGEVAARRSHTARGKSNSTRPAGATASPLLSVLAQQDADALVQRGPVGLVREEGQQVRSERWHLGAEMTFTLGKKAAWDGPVGSRALRAGSGDEALPEP